MMSGTCAGCRKKVGFFDSYDVCGHPDCDIKECDECAQAGSKVLQECDKCGDTYCIKHINSHPCEEEEEEEDEEDEPQDTDEFVSLSTKELWAFVNHVDASTWKDVCDALEELERKGYEFIATMDDGILMRKKKG